MTEKYLTYASSGVGGAYGSKAEKIRIIRDAVESVKNPKNKYVIGGIGGFAAIFDMSRLIEDRNYEEFKREIYRKCGTRRAPYVLVAHWLSWRLRLNEIRRRKHGK